MSIMHDLEYALTVVGCVSLAANLLVSVFTSLPVLHHRPALLPDQMTEDGASSSQLPGPSSGSLAHTVSPVAARRLLQYY